MVAVVACAYFTTFTGASGVTILALGGLLATVLIKSGHYGKDFSQGLITSSGSVGLLFPPALPIIMYAVTAQISMKDMFLGGLLASLHTRGRERTRQPRLPNASARRCDERALHLPASQSLFEPEPPSEAKASMVRSMCSCRCVAMGVSRSLAVPDATVGGLIPCTNTPRSRRCAESCIVRSLSPIKIGRI